MLLEHLPTERTGATKIEMTEKEKSLTAPIGFSLCTMRGPYLLFIHFNGIRDRSYTTTSHVVTPSPLVSSP